MEVSDSNANVVVDVKFDSFKFGAEFSKDAFDMQRNMTAGTEGNSGTDATSPAEQAGENGTKEPASSETAPGQEPTTGSAEGVTDGQTGVSENPEQQGAQDPASGEPGTEEPTMTEPEGAGSFGVIEPTYAPEGVKLKDDQIVEESGDYSVMLRYEGTYNYTIFEARPQDRAVSLAPSRVVDLGFTLGMISGDSLQTLTWMTDGIEYRITSADLPESEMVQIATSMQEQSGK